MKAELRTTALRLGLQLLAAAVVIVVAQIRGLSLADLGIRWPPWNDVALWLGLFVVLVVAEEVVWKAAGMPDPEPWAGKYSSQMIVVRAVAVIVLAPTAEELTFRGILYYVIAGTALGAVGAIVIPALLFTLLHFQYDFRALLFILVDGLFYGVARHSTGSTLLTMLFHSLANAYAVYQRIR